MNTNIENIELVKEKDINNSFLVIKNVLIDKDAYEYKILEEEKIDDIVEYRVDREDGKIILKYNIDGAVALDDYLKINRLKKKDLIFVIESVKKLLFTIENFLISENSVLLDPRSIFLFKNNDNIKLKFCIVPCLISDFSYELSKFLIRLMRHVDTNEKEAIELAYALFIKSSMKNYSISDLMSIIEENKNKIDTVNETEEILSMYNDSNLYDENVQDEENTKYIENSNIEESLKDMTNDVDVEGIVLDDKTKEELGIEIYDEIENNDIDKNINIKKNCKVDKNKIEKSNIKNVISKFKMSYLILPIFSVIVPIFAYFIFGYQFFIKHIFLLIIYEVMIVLIISLNSLIDNLYTE